MWWSGPPTALNSLPFRRLEVFEASLIRGALAKALEEGAQLTDDCSAVERIGMKVSLTPGEYTNLKITTPEGLILAEALLNRRDDR